jgi:hypothetical protein
MVDTAQAGEVASNAAQVITEAAAETASAEDALEAALARAEDAEMMAEDMAEAALESQRAQMVVLLRQECESWRNELSGRLSSLETTLASLQASLIPPPSPPVTVVTENNSPPTPIPATEPVIVNPSENNPDAAPAAPEAPATPRKRFRLI